MLHAHPDSTDFIALTNSDTFRRYAPPSKLHMCIHIVLSSSPPPPPQLPHTPSFRTIKYYPYGTHVPLITEHQPTNESQHIHYHMAKPPPPPSREMVWNQGAVG